MIDGFFSAFRAIRHRWYFRRRFAALHRRIGGRLFQSFEAPRVLTGPFAGLRYLDETVWGPITPKWLGSYEAELHSTLARILAHPYAGILDVGCAEGYYAVGLARAMPGARVEAFDVDFISRRQTRRLARLNSVENLQIHSRCGSAQFEAARHGRTLVLCDIEGGEDQLLDPVAAPGLRACDLLVEVHEKADMPRAIEGRLTERFGSTHRIERFPSIHREAWVREHRQLFPMLNDDQLREASDEHRGSTQVWLWMELP